MYQIQQREGKGRTERGEKRGEKGRKGERRGRKDSSRFQRSGGQQGAAAPVGDAARHPPLRFNVIYRNIQRHCLTNSFLVTFSTTFARLLVHYQPRTTLSSKGNTDMFYNSYSNFYFYFCWYDKSLVRCCIALVSSTIKGSIGSCTSHVKIHLTPDPAPHDLISLLVVYLVVAVYYKQHHPWN